MLLWDLRDTSSPLEVRSRPARLEFNHAPQRADGKGVPVLCEENGESDPYFRHGPPLTRLNGGLGGGLLTVTTRVAVWLPLAVSGKQRSGNLVWYNAAGIYGWQITTRPQTTEKGLLVWPR